MAIRRYKYPMVHQWLSTHRMGSLQPLFLQEVTPGDTWQGSSQLLLRLNPLAWPAFVSVSVDVYFFFVPHRLVWEDFEDEITGNNVPWPRITFSDSDGTNPSFWGIPSRPAGKPESVNALPIRAFNLVYNEFFRDQQLQNERSLDSKSMPNVNHSQHTYEGGLRDVIQKGGSEKVTVTGGEFEITDWRDALHRQKWKERRSQFGDRYTDLLRAMGLQVPDSRLDRPEFVARGKTTIGISEVVTTADSETFGAGNLYGHGIGAMRIPFRRKMFYEYGTLMGVICTRPRMQVRGGIDRMWLTNDRNDLFQVELARDTQVPVTVREFNSNTQNDTEDNIIGYTARDEWLRKPRDVIAGDFLSGTQDEQDWSSASDYRGGDGPDIPTLIAVNSGSFQNIFQDQTGRHARFIAHHMIGKRSIIPRRPK